MGLKSPILIQNLIRCSTQCLGIKLSLKLDFKKGSMLESVFESLLGLKVELVLMQHLTAISASGCSDSFS
jgi:hypothetical protein